MRRYHSRSLFGPRRKGRSGWYSGNAQIRPLHVSVSDMPLLFVVVHCVFTLCEATRRNGHKLHHYFSRPCAFLFKICCIVLATSAACYVPWYMCWFISPFGGSITTIDTIYTLGLFARYDILGVNYFSSAPYSIEDGTKLKSIIRRYAKGVALRDAASVTKACRCDTHDMYVTRWHQHSLGPYY